MAAYSGGDKGGTLYLLMAEEGAVEPNIRSCGPHRIVSKLGRTLKVASKSE